MKHTLFFLLTLFLIAGLANSALAQHGNRGPKQDREPQGPDMRGRPDDAPQPTLHDDDDSAEAPVVDTGEALIIPEDATEEATEAAEEAHEAAMDRAREQRRNYQDKPGEPPVNADAAAGDAVDDAAQEADPKLTGTGNNKAIVSDEKARGVLAQMEAEEHKHRDRVARLERIGELMEAKSNATAMDRVAAALEKENQRHERKMTQLRQASADGAKRFDGKMEKVRERGAKARKEQGKPERTRWQHPASGRGDVTDRSERIERIVPRRPERPQVGLGDVDEHTNEGLVGADADSTEANEANLEDDEASNQADIEDDEESDKANVDDDEFDEND